jgi:glycosyltransferase involved in cell wall biosynthesis
MRYCVLFPQTENVHLIKDVGMIAYKMHKLYGYEAFIACYENGRYPYLEKEVSGLKMDFIKKTFNNEILDGMSYLRINAKKIDVLQVFHVTMRTFFYVFMYRHLNKNGKIFLKLDCTEELINRIKSLKGLKLKLFNKFIDSVNVIGVEQSYLYGEIIGLLGHNKEKLLNIPNGVDFDLIREKYHYDFADKKNIIINVGRIGTPEKDIETMIKAFSLIEKQMRKDWILKLVGPVTDDFEIFIDNFLKNNPEYSGSIILEGPVYDRNRLFQLYREAKIFCSSSKFESFGIALLEGAAFGDVIVSTDTGIARELAGEGNGVVVGINDPVQLGDGLKSIMKKSDTELEKLSKMTYTLCAENYDWNIIVANLNKKIK